MLAKRVRSPSPGKEGAACKQIQAVLGLETVSAATKAYKPAIQKIALMMIYLPIETAADLAEAMQEHRRRLDLPEPSLPPSPPGRGTP